MSSNPSLLVVQDDLYFLLNELEKHCEYTELFFKLGSTHIASRVRARKGYVQTLREKIELGCANLLERRKAGTPYYNQTVAVRSLALALESLAQQFLLCVEEGTLSESYVHPSAGACRKLVKRIERSLKLIKFGLDQDVRRTGIKLGRRTRKLMALYDEIQTQTLNHKAGLSDAQLQAALLANFGLKQLIAQLEQVADALIKVDLGQVATLNNYSHLKNASTSLNYDLSDLKVRRLALTRSGSAIAALSHENETGQQVLAVYKEGERSKIDEEVQGVAHWRKVDPALAPDVLAQTSAKGDTSALLIEHIPGNTLEALLLAGQAQPLQEALSTLFQTLNRTWGTTLTKEPAFADFMQQLRKRIKDSQAVHPDFFSKEQVICGHVRPSFERLIDQVGHKEANWKAPFSVLIHGDFNVDNVIYDDVKQQVYFIDLHRSDYFDYVQDLSVLMVSIYRLQVLETSQRDIMMDAARQIYQFGKRFAKRHDDDTFELRLAVGLARSFATSTRFILDKKLSSRMHLRARYLLEKLASLASEKEAKFKLPLKELYSE
ncbi:phosphotransferase [Marinomonas ostreistagni]|uniref:phosphotransferase n=1 Tax=Marinomonas ostreistagni TaxID=359209 RepID=UPI00194FE4F8|nr:phosphotransferase [Marinomonas ostreistagni]MBM6549810.1 phosphotransferase [Marinomonas ostreistagni]